MKPENRVLFAHLARALARYVPEAERVARQNGSTVPEELLKAAAFFEDCGTLRQGATPLDEPGDVEDRGAMTHPVLTKREAAASLRLSVRQVERLIAAGKLEAVKLEGSTRIRRDDLETYVRGLSSARSFRDSVTEKDTA